MAVSYFKILCPKMTVLLVATVQLASFFIIPISAGHRPQSLVAKSAFIEKSKQSAKNLASPFSNCDSLSTEVSTGTACTKFALSVLRGGAYEDYNDSYGYNDDGKGYTDGKGYIDDYRYNDYEQDTQSYPSSNRYEDDYYNSPRGSDGYYDDEGRYYEDDRDRGGSRRRSSASKSKLPTVLTSGNRKLGIIFLSSGAAFTALGITLFFNKTLMRLGNLLFVCGIPLMIGPGRTLGYFLQPKKARATGCLVCGIFLVLVGHPVIGILLEVFGLLNLFGNMFPVLMIMAKNLPVVGSLFGGDKGSSERRRERSSREDDYYNDGYGDDRGYGRQQDQWD